jgi:hypothetical protein
MLESSPRVASITGNASRYVPVKVNDGLVAPTADDVGFMTTVVAVPTRAAKVA